MACFFEEEGTQYLPLHYFSWLHVQVLVKSQMLQGILRVLLTIMASSQGEDNEEDEMLGEEELGTQSPGSYAAQVNIFN